MVYGIVPAPSPLYPIVVSLDTGETIFIASHTSDLAEGNWIQLSGGTSIKLPSVNLAYAGMDSAIISRPGVTVTIKSSFAAGEATYPLAYHQVYSVVENIIAKFYGATAIEFTEVDFKLISISSITEARELLTDAWQGDLAPLKTKLSEALTKTASLDGAGDATVTINPQSVGNYLLIVTKTPSPSELYIYSATIIEVVSQTLDVTAPSSVEKGDPLYVNTGLTGATYIQGAILIKETAYSGEIKLTTEGTVLSTEIYLNGVLMADGAFASESISYETALLLLNQLGTAFGPNQIAIGINLISGSISLSTSSLTTGDYVLLVGVYNVLGSIVGVYQKTVTVTPPYVPTPGPSKNKLPIADAGPDQKAWVNRTVNFDGSKSKDPDGYILDWGWTWSFGDGETASGKTVPHTYQEPGNYTVTLTVKDNRNDEDTDTCRVTISEPPKPVTDELAELVPGGETDYIVDAMEEANTTVTLNTTDPVTVTIIKYESNPHPEDPIPATALPHYVDVQVSDPDAVIWPIYVEMHYTDEEAEGLEESSLGIYYWMDGAWQRCSNTGVDTELNVVWASMTAHEASGSPILMAGMPAIPVPPLPPIIDNLTITPSELELGDNVTITFDIENIDSQSITYGVDIHIENVNDPHPTWPPYDITLRIWVELEAYESKTVSQTITMDTVGDFKVTLMGFTGSFKVGTWPPEPPPSPGEFETSNLKITSEEAEIWEEIEISFTVTNIGEETGNYQFSLLIEGPFAAGSVEMVGILGAGKSETATYKMTPETPGDYTFTVDGLTEIFTVKAPPKPDEFEASNLAVTPVTVVPGTIVMISATITNIGEERGSHIVELKLDGEVVDSDSVTLNGGASETVTLITSSEAEGRHSVEIDGLSGSFTVEAPPPPKKPLTIWIALIVALVAILIYIIWRRPEWIDQLRASLKR